MKLTPLFLVFGLTLVSCAKEHSKSTDAKQSAATELMIAEADRQVGMPNITNFTERKLMKTILELRDQEGFATYTYIVDMHGELHFLIDSIGYGIPASTQFTNPERMTFGRHGSNLDSRRWEAVLPQPDPNGLFMPTSSDATWVIVAGPDGLVPLYLEPTIIVSPIKLTDH